MATRKKTTKTKLPQTGLQSLVRKHQKRLADYMAKRPHRSFRRTKWPRRKLGGHPVASVWDLIRGSFVTMWQERKLMLGLITLYGVTNFLLVGAIAQSDFVEFKDTVVQVFHGQLDAVGNALTLFTSALSGVLNQPLNDMQQFISYFMAFLFWLVMVWTLRMRFANEKIRIRDALYNASAPFVSTLLVAAAAVGQLLPGAIGVLLLTMAVQLNALQTNVEYILFITGAALFCLLSLYWVVSSLVALVIVTLPGMYPWTALSNASVLVIGQRIKIVIRLLVLAIMYGVIWMAVLLPVLVLDSWLRFDWLPLVPITLQALAGFSLAYCAVYIYKLYRSML